MPRRHRHMKMRGGFLDSLSAWATNAWNKTKSATGFGDSYSSSSYAQPSSNYTATSSPSFTPSTPSTPSTTGYGGKRTRKMRGGIRGYTPTSGLAAHGAPFSGPTAKPHTMVGGKTRRQKKHKHSKSCKHNKH